MAERADVLSRLTRRDSLCIWIPLTRAWTVNDKLWPFPARLGPDAERRNRRKRVGTSGGPCGGSDVPEDFLDEP